MRNILCCSLTSALALAAVTDRANAEAAKPALIRITSGTCLNSPMGFTARLEPSNAGVAWTMSFNATGTADADGNVTEIGRSVDTASFGVGPRMHSPGANAYNVNFTSTVKENSDGSYTITTGALHGTFTEGPHAGQTFTATPGLMFKRWAGPSGTLIETTAGPPVVQTVVLANGVRFARICTMNVVASAPR